MHDVSAHWMGSTEDCTGATGGCVDVPDVASVGPGPPQAAVRMSTMGKARYIIALVFSSPRANPPPSPLFVFVRFVRCCDGMNRHTRLYGRTLDLTETSPDDGGLVVAVACAELGGHRNSLEIGRNTT
jgi:hypothetical protein